MKRKIELYIQTWMERGYEEDIPDEVPDDLMRLQVAPSYKAICFAILRNDHAMKSLGFSCVTSQWADDLAVSVKASKHPQSRLFD